MSLRTVKKPHIKKRVVIIASAGLLVDRASEEVVAELCTLVIAIGRTWTSQMEGDKRTHSFITNEVFGRKSSKPPVTKKASLTAGQNVKERRLGERGNTDKSRTLPRSPT